MQVIWTEKNGVYNATIPLRTRDGRTLYITGSATVGEVAEEFGFTEDEIGSFFGSIGKAFKKIAKNKAFKKALKITKSVLKSPITTAALGVVTGGAAIAPMAAVNIAMNVADMALKGTSKEKEKAKKLIKASTAIADAPMSAAQIATLKQKIGVRAVPGPATSLAPFLAKIAQPKKEENRINKLYEMMTSKDTSDLLSFAF